MGTDLWKTAYSSSCLKAPVKVISFILGKIRYFVLHSTCLKGLVLVPVTSQRAYLSVLVHT